MAVRNNLLLQLVTTLSFLVTVTHQTPIHTAISAMFNPQCFRNAYYLNVRCLVLLWDVSRHPVYGQEESQTSRLNTNSDPDNQAHDGNSSDENKSRKKKRKCRKKRLINCPDYKEVIQDDFKGYEMDCSGIMQCHVDVMRLINNCSLDKSLEVVWETLWNTAKSKACEQKEENSDSESDSDSD
ncbi:uncharacterized protein LOC134193442 [Corticium candelabrum]|uniref:uncharacterized protein LOC134193442 n=1 Tax=Corticium candelabrum TaxID=121492 RepID=UPI002E266E3F|nr:uncharacterized protein LOC134193442 [Corticium candelabrum]